MMYKLSPFVLVVSLAFNVPFVAMSVRSVRDDLQVSSPGKCGVHSLATESARSEQPVPLHPPHPETILRKVIGVSDEQWAVMAERQAKFHREMTETMRSCGRMNLELLDLVAAPATNHDAVRLKQDEILAEQRRTQEMIVNNLLADKRELTEEQQQKLFRMLRQFWIPESPGRQDSDYELTDSTGNSNE